MHTKASATFELTGSPFFFVCALVQTSILEGASLLVLLFVYIERKHFYKYKIINIFYIKIC